MRKPCSKPLYGARPVGGVAASLRTDRFANIGRPTRPNPSLVSWAARNASKPEYKYFVAKPVRRPVAVNIIDSPDLDHSGVRPMTTQRSRLPVHLAAKRIARPACRNGGSACANSLSGREQANHSVDGLSVRSPQYHRAAAPRVAGRRRQGPRHCLGSSGHKTSAPFPPMTWERPNHRRGAAADVLMTPLRGWSSCCRRNAGCNSSKGRSIR